MGRRYEVVIVCCGDNDVFVDRMGYSIFDHRLVFLIGGILFETRDEAQAVADQLEELSE